MAESRILKCEATRCCALLALQVDAAARVLTAGLHTRSNSCTQPGCLLTCALQCHMRAAVAAAAAACLVVHAMAAAALSGSVKACAFRTPFSLVIGLARSAALYRF
jgi:hypothetical protein